MRNAFRPAVLIGLLLQACLGAGPGACSETERAIFDSIEHPGNVLLEAVDHSTGACAARFQTTDPAAVMEHYERELVSNGWLVGPQGTQPDGTPVEMPPNVLQAQRGEMSFGVEIESDGDRGEIVTVLVGEGL